MNDIGDIFASVDGALPQKPFTSFTGGIERGLAVAAGKLSAPDGRHYVACLERTGDRPAPESHGTGLPCYVDEDLRLWAADGPATAVEGEAGGYRVRYLEVFDDPFEAGERYRFFFEALHPTPEEHDTEEERRRDLARGRRRIEQLICEAVVGAICEEVLRAEEEESAASAPDSRSFWRQAVCSGREELSRLVPDAVARERNLAFHRYRRAALAAERGREG